MLLEYLPDQKEKSHQCSAMVVVVAVCLESIGCVGWLRKLSHSSLSLFLANTRSPSPERSHRNHTLSLYHAAAKKIRSDKGIL